MAYQAVSTWCDSPVLFWSNSLKKAPNRVFIEWLLYLIKDFQGPSGRVYDVIVFLNSNKKKHSLCFSYDVSVCNYSFRLKVKVHLLPE